MKFLALMLLTGVCGSTLAEVKIEELSTDVLFEKLGGVVYTANSYSAVIRFNLSLLREQDLKLEEDFRVLTS